jgi:hypothetical protein
MVGARRGIERPADGIVPPCPYDGMARPPPRCLACSNKTNINTKDTTDTKEIALTFEPFVSFVFKLHSIITSKIYANVPAARQGHGVANPPP